MVERTQIVPGIAFPFYPMRPFHGPSCKTAEAAGKVKQLRGTHVLHRKLNGDRVIMAVWGGTPHWANRHGSWYSYGIENKHLFASLRNGTVLDGEVWRKNFYPFDCLSVGGNDTPANITGQPVEARVDLTKKICTALGVPWMWEVEDEWLDKLEQNAPVWEGVVAKKLGSPYEILGSDNQQSSTWHKRKWVI